MRLQRIVRVCGLAAAGLLLAACASGKQGAVCGNRICESGEDVVLCPADCANGLCGNGSCETGESTTGCPGDCWCGNGSCDQGENFSTCVTDCPAAACPNGTCDPGETSATCPQDCPAAVCPNGTCDPGETSATCPQDCPAAACPNGTCDLGETYANCPQDCTCGNDVCEAAAGETITTCPEDCDLTCVDATCDLSPQCGCTGQKCAVTTTGTHQCVDAGTGPVASVCTLDTQCVRGTLCIGAADSDALCTQYCVTDLDCTGNGAACILEYGQTGQPAWATLCTVSCDPITNVGCPTAFTCHPYSLTDDPTVQFTDCANDAGTVATGGTCDGVTTLCQPGNFCATSVSECVEYCRVGYSDCTLYTCQSFTQPSVIGGIEYGYCY